MKKFYLSFSGLLFGSFITVKGTTAASLPLDPSNSMKDGITPTTTDDLFGGFTNEAVTQVVPLYSAGINFITALFVIGALVMTLSILFRNGQWQKYAQGTMFISFVTIILLRGLPILIYSMRSIEDANVLLSQGIYIVTYVSIFLSVVSIAVSFLFRFGYHLIEHPDFYRWSKNLVSVSVLMMVFSIVVPYIVPAL